MLFTLKKVQMPGPYSRPITSESGWGWCLCGLLTKDPLGDSDGQLWSRTTGLVICVGHIAHFRVIPLPSGISPFFCFLG